MIELGLTRCTKGLCYDHIVGVQFMHNLISYNQLAGSNIDPHDDLITEYYECLIECEEDQQTCKRICKEELVY